MVTDPFAQLLLSVLLAATTVWLAVRTVRSRGRVARIGHGVHVLMGLSMLAMTWGAPVPVWPQVVLFSLAALWFGVVAASPAGHRSAGEPGAGRTRWLPWFHTAMSLSMVWMLLVGHPAGGAGSGGHSHVAIGALPVTSGLVLLVLLVAGTALSVTATLPLDPRPGRARVRGWDVSHAAMGVGMVAMTAPALLV